MRICIASSCARFHFTPSIHSYADSNEKRGKARVVLRSIWLFLSLSRSAEAILKNSGVAAASYRAITKMAQSYGSTAFFSKNQMPTLLSILAMLSSSKSLNETLCRFLTSSIFFPATILPNGTASQSLPSIEGTK